METKLVDFLNPGNRPRRGRDQYVDALLQPPSLSTGQTDRAASHLTPLLGSTDDIRRVSARADSDENITRSAESLHLPREDLLEAVVVADRSQ